MADASAARVSDSRAQSILTVVQVAYPLILLVSYIAAFTAESILSSTTTDDDDPTVERLGPGGKPLPKKKNKRASREQDKLNQQWSRPRKLLFQWLQTAVIMTLGGNCVIVVTHALVDRRESWWCGQAPTTYLVASFMVYILLVITLFESKRAPNVGHAVSWTTALVMELILLGASFSYYKSPHREPKVDDPAGGEMRLDITKWEVLEITVDLVRIILLLGLVFSYVLFRCLGRRRSLAFAGSNEETEQLLANGSAVNGNAVGADANGAGYGTTATAANGKPPGASEAPAGWEKPSKIPSRSWWEYVRAYGLFLPYIWPSKNRMLQINFVVCIVIVLIQRAIQILVPIQVGAITEILAGGDGPVRMPWSAILLYIVYRIFQGSNGLLGAARQILWIPIEQYSYRELSVAAFEHVHSLSLDFHLGKKTGEVLSALGKGASLNTFLESITFNVLPMLIDLGLAVLYFFFQFNSYYALVIAVVTFWYIYITIRMAAWRADIRRQATNASREEDAVKNDSMMSYETVKYFNAESYEFDRYRGAVNKYQKAEYLVTLSLALMNTIQNLVFMAGLIVACFIAAYQVTIGQLNVGKFVTLLTYMTQLQSPLNFFGTFYRMIQNNMINSERLLELFKEQPTVVDKPDVEELVSCEGDIRYNDVHFSYDTRKPALHGLTFRCKPGTTTALVGESGGGKSTVFRLLFRYYNPEAGHLQVDGHDVQDISIDSLRRHIGVVPQDTVLFNESLMYNLRYARQSATDEEIYEACRAASIHDKILGFPDGYETRVGERGLRLSGGEKQRVAIARTIIKNPRIILLDEATAALDTETEEHIQEALQTLAKGRTMLVIAHRLSTVTMCDQILVLHEGRVAERGTHSELLAMKGRYSGMWRKQVRAQRAAEEAKVLKDKADRLRRESMDGTMRQRPGMDDSPHSSDEDEHHRRPERDAEEPSDFQEALSLSPRSSVPLAQIATTLSQETGTDNMLQVEMLRSGTVRSPPVVTEEQAVPKKHDT